MKLAGRVISGWGYFLWHDRLRDEDYDALVRLGQRLGARLTDRARGALGLSRR